MSSRRDFYFRQLVTEAELDAAFTGMEDADRALLTDMGLAGIHDEAEVSEKSGTPDLSVDVTSGVIYDQEGQRISIETLQNVDVSVDDDDVSTDVAGGGNEKWVSVFVVFERALSDPRVDGNSNTVYFVRSESYRFSVVQGAEAVIGLANKPSLLSDGILLADINLVNGKTQVFDADISTRRRQTLFNVDSGALQYSTGQIAEAFDLVTEAFNQHVAGTSYGHAGADISYGGGSAWFDGTTNPATTVEAQLDKIITDLIDSTSTDSGAHKIGCDARTTWLGGRTNASGVSVFAAIDKIITDLAATTASDDGAERIGVAALGNWLDGLTNPATSVNGALQKIITDLSDAVGTTASGANRIGLAASGDISSTNVGAAIYELDSEKAKLADVQIFTSSNTWTKPTNAKSVEVWAVGAGGGGGSGRKGASGTDRAGGGGGGGGARSHSIFRASDLGSTVAVTVGTGGTGGAATSTDSTDGTIGGDGTATTFGALLRAGGGSGGSRGGDGSAAPGGTGGTGDHNGGDGGDGKHNTNGSNGTSGSAAGGGGGGGGATAADAENAGGTGGSRSVSYDAAGAGAGSAATGGGAHAGSAGGSVTANIPNGGGGGGGGASQVDLAGGPGGAGGTYGGGGGGGGGAQNSVGNSGAGGDGANGICVVVSYF